MECRIFRMTCDDRGVAEEVAAEVEKMGLFVERHGERSKRRHKKSSGIVRETLLVKASGEDADLTAILSELMQLSRDYSGVQLLL